MISYTQRSDRATVLARELRTSLQTRGCSTWLDVDMQDKSEAAMQEAVQNSSCVLAVITGDGPDDPNAYLNRDFCRSELRWAFAAEKHLQPVVHMDDKKRIGEFIAMAPEDFDGMNLQELIGSKDFVDLNMSDMDYWQVGLDKILARVPGL